MLIAVIKENQSALDLATQHLGTAEASFNFCLLNGISLTEDLISSDVVEISEQVETVVEVSDYFAKKGIELATGYPLIAEEAIGIGVMIIEQNFTVT